MRLLAVDIGIKNLCIIIVEDDVVRLAKLYQLGNNYINKIVEIMDTVFDKNIDVFLIEKQLNKNVKCMRIETAIETYCIINKLKYKKVHPRDKYKHYSVYFEKYYDRKKWVVQKGTEIFSEFFNYDITESKKKDDLCDCIIMLYLEFLELNERII